MHICLFHVCLRWCAFILTFLNEIWHFPMQICHLICPSRGVSRLQNVLKFKNVWIWSERGGRNFSKMSEIQKVLNYPRGWGSSLIGNFSNIFYIPTSKLMSIWLNLYLHKLSSSLLNLRTFWWQLTPLDGHRKRPNFIQKGQNESTSP